MNIVVSSRFRPFTYDELMKPRRDYTEAYEKVELQYQELADQTDFWRQIVGLEGENSQVYQTYNAYDKALASIVDDFSKGMNPRNRRQLSEMRRRFHGEIKPIENAYNVRQKQIEALHEGRLKGIVYENDAATTSLDEYIKNPLLLYNGVDSTAGFNRLASVATALSKGIVNASATGRLDAYTKEFMQKYGYDVLDVLSGIALVMADLDGILTGNLSSKGAKMIQDLLTNEVLAAGISDWSVGARREYINKVAPALYQAVGPMQISPMEDFAAREGLKYSNSINLLNAKLNNSTDVSKDDNNGTSKGGSKNSSLYTNPNVKIDDTGTPTELGDSEKPTGQRILFKESKGKKLKNGADFDVVITDLSGNTIGWVNTKTKKTYTRDKDIINKPGKSLAALALLFLYNSGEDKQYNYYYDENTHIAYRSRNTATKEIGNSKPTEDAAGSLAVTDLMNDIFGAPNTD